MFYYRKEIWYIFLIIVIKLIIIIIILIMSNKQAHFGISNEIEQKWILK